MNNVVTRHVTGTDDMTGRREKKRKTSLMGLLDYVFIHRIFLAFTLMQEKKNNRTRNYLFILGSIPEQNNNSIYPAVYYWYYKYKIVNFE